MLSNFKGNRDYHAYIILQFYYQKEDPYNNQEYYERIADHIISESVYMPDSDFNELNYINTELPQNGTGKIIKSMVTEPLDVQ